MIVIQNERVVTAADKVIGKSILNPHNVHLMVVFLMITVKVCFRVISIV